jgi:nucleotide-binding universal stress UspA family protein
MRMRAAPVAQRLRGDKEAAMNSNRILIATDGSAGAAVAVDQGVWLAKMVGAEVIFLAVARSPLPILGDPYYQRALTADLAKARTAIANATLAADERHVSYDTEIVEGSPADAILELARNRDVDFIVVGSRGRGAVTGAVLGSVSSEVVHRADRPVLVARPGVYARAGETLRAAV